MAHDIFISHASDDKTSLVDPLVEYLSGLGLDVWYDKASLQAGDSLSRSIDNGLATSRFALVVLSPAFLKKPWPEYELRGLVAREIGQEKVIIPIWFGVCHREVLEYSPTLADKFALNADNLSIPQLAMEIIRVVRPDVHGSILRRIYWTNKLKKAKPGLVKASDIKPSPIRHETLPFGLRLRSKLIVHTVGAALGLTLEQFLDNLKRDMRPERELQIWEVIASCYLDYVSVNQLTDEQRKEVGRLLVRCSLGRLTDDDISDFQPLSDAQVFDIATAYVATMREHPDAEPKSAST